MDIISRWRDAINDPPPEGWRGLIRNPDEGVTVWFRDYRGKHYVGDQWLDITDTPAVPLVKVQAAVDEIAKWDLPYGCDTAEAEAVKRYGGSWRTASALRFITNHTGITPSEVTP